MRETSEAPWGWTYSDYASLPDDGNHYEVIDGEVCVTPAAGTRHQIVAAQLFVLLNEYVERHRLGRVLWDVDLLFQTGQYLRPDMLFVPTRSLGGVTHRGIEAAPDLVVEVLSPYSHAIDRIKKAPRYREFGIPEYWVVDPVGHTVEVYRPALETPEVHEERLVWRPDPYLPPLEIDLEAVFR